MKRKPMSGATSSWRRRIRFCLGMVLGVFAAPGASALTISFDDLALEHGSIVSDPISGVSISATNFNRDFNLAVAFDSNAEGSEDPDLEAVFGSADGTFWSGGNLEGQDLGIMLIIQENDQGCIRDSVCDLPDDEGGRQAGELSFLFEEFSVTEFGFDLIDLEGVSRESESGKITFHDGEDSVEMDFGVLLKGFELGNNTANRIDPILASELGLEAFDEVVITLGGSGAIDNVSFEPVPEPSSGLLASLGLVGLSLLSRRLA